jgi:hypothetical protein
MNVSVGAGPCCSSGRSLAVSFQNQKPLQNWLRQDLGIRFSDIAVQAKLDFKHVSGSEKKYLRTFSGGVA